MGNWANLSSSHPGGEAGLRCPPVRASSLRLTFWPHPGPNGACQLAPAWPRQEPVLGWPEEMPKKPGRHPNCGQGIGGLGSWRVRFRLQMGQQQAPCCPVGRQVRACQVSSTFLLKESTFSCEISCFLKVKVGGCGLVPICMFGCSVCLAVSWEGGHGPHHPPHSWVWLLGRIGRSEAERWEVRVLNPRFKPA